MLVLEINRKGRWLVGWALSAEIFRLFRLQPRHFGISSGRSLCKNVAIVDRVKFLTKCPAVLMSWLFPTLKSKQYLPLTYKLNAISA